MDAQFEFFNTLFTGMTQGLAAAFAPPLANVAATMATTNEILAAQTQATLATNTVLAAQNQATVDSTIVLRDIRADLHHRQGPTVTINQLGRLEPFTGVNANPQSVLAFLTGVRHRTDLLSGCPAQQLIILFGSFLSEEAAVWFDLQVKPFIGTSINTLGQAIDAFKSRYLPSNYLSITRAQLRDLKQTTGMTAYIQAFQRLSQLLQADEIYGSNKFLTHSFVGGLSPEVKLYFTANEDTCLLSEAIDEAQRVALDLDKRQEFAAHRRVHAAASVGNNSQDVEMEDATSLFSGMKLEELALRLEAIQRAQRSCSYCKKTGHLVNQCWSKKRAEKEALKGSA